MKIIKHLSPCQILIEKVFSPQDLTKIEERVLKAKCQEVSIPGFRPGNAPLDKIRAILEPTAEWEKLIGIKLQEEMIDNWAESYEKDLGEIVKIMDLKVIKRDPLTIECSFEYFPRISEEMLKENHKNINIGNIQKPSQIKVSDKEVEDALLELQKRRTSLKPAAGSSLEKDKVAFITTLLINEKVPGEEKPDSLVGRDLFQWGIGQYGSDFDEQVKGMREGEERKISISQSKDGGFARLEKIIDLKSKLPENNQDKKINLTVKMEKIFTSEVPPIDDNFAKSLGNFNNLAELKSNIEHGMLLEKLHQEKNKRKESLIDALLKNIDLELPESIVKKSAEGLKKDFENRINQEFGEKALEINQKKSEEEQAKFNQIFEERARKELKLERILEAIAQKEKIVPSVKEVDDEIQKIIRSFSSPKEAKKSLGDPQKLTDKVTLALCFDKTMQYLEKENKISADIDEEMDKIEKEHHH